MPGFLISNLSMGEIKYKSQYKADYVFRQAECGEWHIQELLLNKFMNDKILYEDDSYLIITEGVILNKCILCQNENVENLAEYIKLQVELGNVEFWNNFRGSFSGAIYYKSEDVWYVYTNHIGDKSVFVWENASKGEIIVSSSIDIILDVLKENDYSYSLNEHAVYNLLTYGSQQDIDTLFTGINRLQAGTYLKISNRSTECHRYHLFNNTDTINMPEEEIIEELDKRFCHAIKLEYDKDLEYGYQHLASLSGGLDSRMNVWVARKLGYENIHTITFCLSGYWDEIVAEKLARHLRCNHLFKALDDAYFMKKLDQIARMSYGVVSSSQIMHTLHMTENFNFDKFGAIQSGGLGDVVISSFEKNMEHGKPNPFSKTYSVYLKDKNFDKSYDKYENSEMYLMYTRGFLGALGSQIAHGNYIESYSPFCDVDLMEFCFKIPLKYRANHYIYKKWIIQKYPEAAEFEWETIRGKITDSPFKLKMRHGYRKLLRIANKFLFKKSPSETLGMNPFDYWYKSFDDVRKYMDDYFEKNINSKFISEDLREDMTKMYYNVPAGQKIQVLTVLSVTANFFDNF